MIEVFIYLLIYSLLEGIREGIFYNINRSANFPNRAEDKLRKKINVALWLFFVVFLMISKNDLSILFAAVGFRLFFLELALNLHRNFPIFYVGTVSDLDVAQRKVAKFLNINLEVFVAIVRITVLIGSITLTILL